MARLFWIFFLKCNGWNTKVLFPSSIKKAVVIVGPHTSNWDFIFGLAYRSVSKIKHSKFLGKSQLFKWPYGFIFRALGGIAVDRKSNHNIVEQVATEFNKSDEFLLAIAPEGTRKKVTQLKTGFYYIAKASNVPIIMAGMDFEKKTLVYSEPFFPTENESKDFKTIINFFAAIKGKNPEQGVGHLVE